ncbi:MAG TPA: S-methyl-5-thioribose-1-phosphate isomerase, partial [Thermoanaerobaculia bacterium]
MTDPRPADETTPFSPIRWENGKLLLIDQTQLPAREHWLTCEDPEQVADAIRRLAVRGAPAIGVAAAYGLVLGMNGATGDAEQARRRFDEVSALLGATRPTAVNLRWALEKGRAVFEEHVARNAAEVAPALLAWADALHAEDVRINRQIGAHGARLFAPGCRVLTHCNTGSLATAGYGTALGIIQSAFGEDRVEMV